MYLRVILMLPGLQHGQDGLSNISTTHPHFTPPPHIPGSVHAHLDVSDKPAHEVMLEVLGREERGSVSVIALGPSTFSIDMSLKSHPGIVLNGAK